VGENIEIKNRKLCSVGKNPEQGKKWNFPKINFRKG
jgi:hypothetical protein